MNHRSWARPLLDEWTASIVAIAMALTLFFALGAAMAGAQDGAPNIPHDLAGKEKCLLCHSEGGMVPVPSNHSSYTEAMCTSCHQPAETAGETPETPEPALISEEEPQEEETVTSGAGPALSCEQCHSQPRLSMTLESGEELPVYVDPDVYADSIHGQILLCTDCHATIDSYPHPALEISNRREYSLTQYELCKRCHFDNYTKTLDSIHYKLLSEGDLMTPSCTDCHGAHDVTSPSQPRASISQTCAQCHPYIYGEYIDSVHGTSLIMENNLDVPVCTDCHQSHTIEDPRTASFRLESVHLCSNCHSNAELMAKYGISPNVVKTYLNDFHGRTVALVEKQEREIWVEEAVCTDCHGIHNIQQVNKIDSPVIKQNLVATCGKCHDNVNLNFPGAWLSHYEPSITTSPLIFFVRWFYRILIPFILVGLSIHILIDLWRRITNR